MSVVEEVAPGASPAPDTGGTMLRVNDLVVEFPRPNQSGFRAVSGVTFELHRGETLGIVGESGSGKTMIALSLLGIVPLPGKIIEGTISLRERRIDNLPLREIRKVRGNDIGIVFQDPMTGLNPVRTVGSQLMESAMPPSHLTLVGVFLAPGREEAFLADSSQANKVTRVQKGEQIDRYRLAKITSTQVTLSLGPDAGEVDLSLRLLDSQGAKKAPRILPEKSRVRSRAGQTSRKKASREPKESAPDDTVKIRQQIQQMQRRLRKIRRQAAGEHRVAPDGRSRIERVGKK